MKLDYKTLFLLVLFAIAGCSLYRMAEFNSKYGQQSVVDRHVEALPPGSVSFHDDVQPILEQRCDVCHSCYDAPCQLKMTSFEGIDRGGSKKLVYNSARITADDPTRLFIDANTTEEWRDMNFHPVLNERRETPLINMENSVLYLMLKLKKENPLPSEGLLPETFDLRLDHNYICTTAEDFVDFKEKYPLWGMPYALPGLTEKEYETITEWVRQGGRVTPAGNISDKAKRIVSEWESFFNGESLKQKLVARYIYEHLFIGRIHFEQLPEREFYRMVRSKTPPGEPIMEIKTVRPYDNPGVEKFYYRLRKIESTIVVKDHTVYHMNPEKMDRYRELFLQDNYSVSNLPSYDEPENSNAFKTFAAIPSKARYQFMLDDAGFFVMGFIKGPVCRGQIALNVINDHFFVAFTNPEKDTISNDSEFLSSASDFLRLPSERKSNIRILAAWLAYRNLQKQYLALRNQHLKASDPEDNGREMAYIWNGDGANDNALLTVFRHFDSASVVKGFIGKMPRTGWVIDYPLFERIHYLLVAGFNVYGNVGHQAETRIYMDYLRMEAESNFLSFLPVDSREAIWESWYTDARDEATDYLVSQFYGLEYGTEIDFQTSNPKDEFFNKLLAHVGPATNQHDHLNRCPDAGCIHENEMKNIGQLEQEADRQIMRLGAMRGEKLQVLPDVAFLHVVMGTMEKDLNYTIIRNKALSNNSMMFREDHRRRLEDDTLTIVKGYVGSYPNAFYRIPMKELESAVDEYLAIKDAVGYYMLGQKYSIQRNNPEFWKESDWHYHTFLEQEPIEGGVFDMYRFHRIGEKADGEKFQW
jgi:fatty acid cis/trans isomerase CTI